MGGDGDSTFALGQGLFEVSLTLKCYKRIKRFTIRVDARQSFHHAPEHVSEALFRYTLFFFI